MNTPSRVTPADRLPKDATRLLTRHPANPLLKVSDYPGIAQLYNPSPVRFGDKILLLVSVITFRGGNGIDSGETRLAESADGVHFRLADEPFVTLPARPPFDRINRHLIDSRVTRIDDTYYIVTPVMSDQYDGPCAVLGRTKDFKSYEAMDIISHPRNRGASLFPEKIGGLYYKIDRPGGGPNSYCTMWISSSPDLIHWGRFRPLLHPGYKFWNANRVGPTPPIRTDRGWLVIVHGQWGPPGGKQYYIGAILLDLHDPSVIVGKTGSYLLAPQMDYEMHGNCDNTVFPCGALADHAKDELWLYYGGADSCVCLATGSLSAVVDACVREI
jgi:predicted GH43/DUF377 family glycosyl hydrolase